MAAWLGDIEGTLYQRLVKLGLAAEREGDKGSKEKLPRLGAFLENYVASRLDVKPATKEVWSQTTRNLTEHFGADRELAGIDAGDGEDFKTYLLSQGLAATTIAKRLSFARQFFRMARKRKFVDANPFADVSANAASSKERQFFVSREATERILAVCNPTWRLIVTLARYGGLRCPSEVLSLRWSGIDWASGRIVVDSPKTEHHPGKDCRVIPLFPELRPILTEAFELAPEGAEFVVDAAYRKSALTPTGWRNCNLRTQFERLIKRAGLAPWPRLFHNLRASRETELAGEYPLHVVTSWLGNTPRIAMRHYLQVTDSDFERAARGDEKSGAESGAVLSQFAAQPASATICHHTQETAKALVSKGFRPIPASVGGIISGEDRIRTCGPR